MGTEFVWLIFLSTALFLPVPALTSPHKPASLVPTQPHGTSDPALRSPATPERGLWCCGRWDRWWEQVPPCWPRVTGSQE